MWANMRFVEGAGELLMLRKNGDPLARPADHRVFWVGSVGMTRILTAPGALFRDRELFVHDGTKLRRMHVSWRAQALFALCAGILVAFSTFSAVRFISPVHSQAASSKVPAAMARLAAATEQR